MTEVRGKSDEYNARLGSAPNDLRSLIFWANLPLNLPNDYFGFIALQSKLGEAKGAFGDFQEQDRVLAQEYRQIQLQIKNFLQGMAISN